MVRPTAVEQLHCGTDLPLQRPSVVVSPAPPRERVHVGGIIAEKGQAVVVSRSVKAADEGHYTRCGDGGKDCSRADSRNRPPPDIRHSLPTKARIFEPETGMFSVVQQNSLLGSIHWKGPCIKPIEQTIVGNSKAQAFCLAALSARLRAREQRRPSPVTFVNGEQTCLGFASRRPVTPVERPV